MHSPSGSADTCAIMRRSDFLQIMPVRPAGMAQRLFLGLFRASSIRSTRKTENRCVYRLVTAIVLLFRFRRRLVGMVQTSFRGFFYFGQLAASAQRGAIFVESCLPVVL